MATARLWLALAVSVALTSCRQAPDPAKPALWEVTGPAGSHAWLFGTIHALPRPAAWRSAPIDAALAQADRIVVELDPRREGAGREFDILARTPDQPPLSTRVRPELRPPLAALLAKAGRSEADFAETETWAAALILARAGPDQDNANGIDRAVVALAGRRPVIELEGTRGQLGLFDSLPEAEQRDLLASVIADPQADGSSSANAWRRGDMAAIERETRRGLLADPELRAVLFTGRNRAWAERIAAMLNAGQRPFVAVGGAHLAGGDGLPALLVERGFTAKRVQ